MDLKEITDETEKLLIEDMQNARNAKEQWQAEMYYNWAVGTLTLWRRLARAAKRQESDLAKWNELAKYENNVEERFSKLVSTDQVPLLRIEE